MSEFFKAELKDRFLSYAADRDDYFETQLLYDEFLRPHYSMEYVEKLIKEIINHDPDLLDIMSGNGVKIFMLSATAYTQDFLDEGGFTDLFVNEEEKWDTFINQLSNSRKLSDQEKQNLGHKEKVVYKRERSLLFGLLTVVVLSFIMSLYNLMQNIFVTPKYVQKNEVELLLQQEINGLRAQNNALKNQLNQVLLNQNKVKNDSLFNN